MERPLGENATMQTFSSNPKAEQDGGEGGLECDDTKETNSSAGEHTSPSERVSFGRLQHSTVLCSHNPKGNQRCQRINRQTLRERQQNASDKRGRTRHCAFRGWSGNER